MAKPYSLDLRERVVASVEHEGLSCRQAAVRFGVGISTAIKRVRRLHETGDVAPGQMGGHRPKKIAGEYRVWLLQRCLGADFTLRGLVAELGERGLVVDYRSVWEFVHAEKLSYKKRRWSPASRTAPTSRVGASSGDNTRTRLTQSVWSSSTKPG